MGQGRPSSLRGWQGTASLAGPSWCGHKCAHATLSHPWGRCGMSAAHRLCVSPTGYMSAPCGCLSHYPIGLSALHPATSHLVLFFSSCDMVPSSCIKSEALQPEVGQ